MLSKGSDPHTHELHYETATSLLAQLRDGTTTSEALVRLFIKRRNLVNPALNAVVTFCDEQALSDARIADNARQRGDSLGPLHGLPMTIKDTWETKNVRTTAGSRLYQGHIPTTHADAVQKLMSAGVILMGKSNVPVMAADIQTFNPIFGMTRNPWNTAHTSGGSSGGAASALAAGLTPLEIGSDIGGSIRTPAHFCGIFGHKPTRDIISLRGHIPGAPGTKLQPDLAVGGPLARSVDDLELLLNVLAGPRPTDAPHWKLELPPPDFSELKGLRVGVWMEDEACPVDHEMLAGYTGLLKQLQEAGAVLVDAKAAMPELVDMNRILPVYFNLLGSMIGLDMPVAERLVMK